MPKGNPNPIQPDRFKQQQYHRLDADGDSLAQKVRGVKLSQKIDQLIEKAFNSNPERAAWLRRILHVAAIAELLPQQLDKAKHLLEQGVEVEQVAELTGVSIQDLHNLTPPDSEGDSTLASK
jgi:phytoene dehydrogenase-like protein